jgi:hypothetical protein
MLKGRLRGIHEAGLFLDQKSEKQNKLRRGGLKASGMAPD